MGNNGAGIQFHDEKRYVDTFCGIHRRNEQVKIMDERIFTYRDATGRKRGFVLSAEDQTVSDIIWETTYKILSLMQQNSTISNYAEIRDTCTGEIYEQKT